MPAVGLGVMLQFLHVTAGSGNFLRWRHECILELADSYAWLLQSLYLRLFLSVSEFQFALSYVQLVIAQLPLVDLLVWVENVVVNCLVLLMLVCGLLWSALGEEARRDVDRRQKSALFLL